MKKEILQKAIDTYGFRAQKQMCIEEMSELTKAICKLDRAKGGKQTVDAIKAIHEEIADVQIMAEQMKIMFGPAEVNAKINEKIDRLERRLEAER